MNPVHVAELVLVGRSVHVSVQKTLQHVEKLVIILVNLELVLRLESQSDGGTLASRGLVLLFLLGEDLRALVHRSQALAEDGVQSHEVIPIAVAEEELVGLVLRDRKRFRLVLKVRTRFFD